MHYKKKGKSPAPPYQRKMISYKESQKNRHLTDFLDVRGSVIDNVIPEMQQGLKSDDKEATEEKKLKDY